MEREGYLLLLWLLVAPQPGSYVLVGGGEVLGGAGHPGRSPARLTAPCPGAARRRSRGRRKPPRPAGTRRRRWEGTRAQTTATLPPFPGAAAAHPPHGALRHRHHRHRGAATRRQPAPPSEEEEQEAHGGFRLRVQRGRKNCGASGAPGKESRCASGARG